MRALGVQATIRLSFSLYNLSSEIDQLAQGLRKVREIF
jgi:selenocysteine lyase/cysteine desulfurase